MAIINHENPLGVVVQFGGQTAINLARTRKHGVKILGYCFRKEIDNAEDRDKFEELLHKTRYSTTTWKKLHLM